MLDWYDVTEAPHERTFNHECRLDSLPHEWERELASLWRLKADVNNGAYLQFLSNLGSGDVCVREPSPQEDWSSPDGGDH